MFSLRNRTDPSHSKKCAPPVCWDLKPIAVFHEETLLQGAAAAASLGMPRSPGQVGKLMGAVVENQSDSESAQPPPPPCVQ